jgi:hypothetical protein
VEKSPYTQTSDYQEQKDGDTGADETEEVTKIKKNEC